MGTTFQILDEQRSVSMELYFASAGTRNRDSLTEIPSKSNSTPRLVLVTAAEYKLAPFSRLQLGAAQKQNNQSFFVGSSQEAASISSSCTVV